MQVFRLADIERVVGIAEVLPVILLEPVTIKEIGERLVEIAERLAGALRDRAQKFHRERALDGAVPRVKALRADHEVRSRFITLSPTN